MFQGVSSTTKPGQSQNRIQKWAAIGKNINEIRINQHRQTVRTLAPFYCNFFMPVDQWDNQLDNAFVDPFIACC